MAFHDHTCEECSHWDDINGCWANGSYTRFGSAEIACPQFDGDDSMDDEMDYDHPEDDPAPLDDDRCRFPGKCLMPGPHMPSECHTKEMQEQQKEKP